LGWGQLGLWDNKKSDSKDAPAGQYHRAYGCPNGRNLRVRCVPSPVDSQKRRRVAATVREPPMQDHAVEPCEPSSTAPGRAAAPTARKRN
jgi:hypothetical protein